MLDAYASEFRQFVDARIQMFVPLLVGKRVRRKLLSLHKDCLHKDLTAHTLRHYTAPREPRATSLERDPNAEGREFEAEINDA